MAHFVDFKTLDGKDRFDHFRLVEDLVTFVAEESPRRRSFEKWVKRNRIYDRDFLKFLCLLCDVRQEGKKRTLGDFGQELFEVMNRDVEEELPADGEEPVALDASEVTDARQEEVNEILYDRLTEINLYLVRFIFLQIEDDFIGMPELFRRSDSAMYTARPRPNLGQIERLMSWLDWFGYVKKVGFRYKLTERALEEYRYLKELPEEEVLDRETVDLEPYGLSVPEPAVPASTPPPPSEAAPAPSTPPEPSTRTEEEEAPDEGDEEWDMGLDLPPEPKPTVIDEEKYPMPEPVETKTEETDTAGPETETEPESIQQKVPSTDAPPAPAPPGTPPTPTVEHPAPPPPAETSPPPPATSEPPSPVRASESAEAEAESTSRTIVGTETPPESEPETDPNSEAAAEKAPEPETEVEPRAEVEPKPAADTPPEPGPAEEPAPQPAATGTVSEPEVAGAETEDVATEGNGENWMGDEQFSATMAELSAEAERLEDDVRREIPVGPEKGGPYGHLLDPPVSVREDLLLLAQTMTHWYRSRGRVPGRHAVDFGLDPADYVDDRRPYFLFRVLTLARFLELAPPSGHLSSFFYTLEDENALFDLFHGARSLDRIAEDLRVLEPDRAWSPFEPALFDILRFSHNLRENPELVESLDRPVTGAGLARTIRNCITGDSLNTGIFWTIREMGDLGLWTSEVLEEASCVPDTQVRMAATRYGFLAGPETPDFDDLIAASRALSVYFRRAEGYDESLRWFGTAQGVL